MRNGQKLVVVTLSVVTALGVAVALEKGSHAQITAPTATATAKPVAPVSTVGPTAKMSSTLDASHLFTGLGTGANLTLSMAHGSIAFDGIGLWAGAGSTQPRVTIATTPNGLGSNTLPAGTYKLTLGFNAVAAGGATITVSANVPGVALGATYGTCNIPQTGIPVQSCTVTIPLDASSQIGAVITSSGVATLKSVVVTQY